MSIEEQIINYNLNASNNAFWAKLLNGEDINSKQEDSPLMWLLQILVKRASNATAFTEFPQDLKNAIITKTLKFSNLEVKAEKKIKEVAPSFFSTNWPTVKKDCEDELDIYLKCYLNPIQNNNLSIEELEIIIENKVDAQEDGPKQNITRKGYDDLYQTDRYYNACVSTSSSKKLQLFVFLTPGKVGNVTSATNKNFIQISYQDLLEAILVPLRDSESLLSNQREEIEDYMNALH